MALPEFLRNVRIGGSLRTPAIRQHQTSRQLARAALWLTPRVVEGFDRQDFPDLTESQRAELATRVERFRSIAASASPNKPVTELQFRQGLDAYNQVLEILQPYFADPEGEQALQILMATEFPEFVLGMYCETEEDSTGAEVLDIWVIVTDQIVETSEFWSQFDQIREQIDDRLRAAGIQKWWHVNVRTASEHLTLMDADQP
jgi:hypothetical protein